MSDRINVLDIPLYSKDIPEACDHIINVIESKQPKKNFCVSATGAHGLVYAQSNADFRHTLLNFYLNLPDGMPGVWIGRMKGAREMKRCYGPDFFKTMMTHTANREINHFFCGGKEGVAEELKRSVKTKFGNSNVTGLYCPPFLAIDKYDYASIARQIDSARADIVWIGLSTPKQELFARRLAEFSRVNFIITVGAAFDFHTGKVTQAPSILQKAGLEWLFRLFMEPKRLFRRYLEIVPLFIYYNLRELLTFATRKSYKN